MRFSTASVKRKLSLGKLAVLSTGVGYTYYAYRNFCDGLANESVYRVSPYKLVLYRVLPLSGMTSLAGRFASLSIPTWLRRPLYGAFSWLYGCDMTESEPLESYPTFNHFFTRSLKTGLRPVSSHALVSPADGKILALGKLDPSAELFPEQIKGVRYPLARFLGEEVRGDPARGEMYYCSVYLAPGSYHRFHSPAEAFAVDRITHIRGEVLPVAPWMMRLVPGLVSLNERAVLHGRWKHGRLFMAPVGATNVRSITFKIPTETRCVLHKGQEVGQFEMGSLVVLVFEGPPGLEWKVEADKWVRCGEALADVPASRSWWPFD